jgi:ABC-2 type transport system ATP-binding protein
MTKKIIEVDNLVVKYGHFEAVKGISFSVDESKIFAFLGPNGAGKSTTIKVLTTLIPPTSGQVLLNSQDVVRNKLKARQSFGIVFQDPSLDDELTAYENMRLHAVLYHLPRKEIKDRIMTLLTLVELDDRRDSRVKTFSGGMKRRLEIARGLLHHPKVLFLDEPTVGLDAQTRNLLWHYVQKLNKSEDMTVFFTTHYLEEAENYAQEIVILDHGEIIAQGSAADLMKKNHAKNLEEAYLNLTGRNVRDESFDEAEAFKMRARTRRGLR